MQATTDIGTRIEPQRQRRSGSLVYGITLALWAVLAVSILIGPDSVTSFWAWSQALHPLLRGVVWVVFLPWMAALAMWESAWAVWVKVGAIAVVAWATTFAVSPRME